MQNLSFFFFFGFSLGLNAANLDFNRLHKEMKFLENSAKAPIFFFGESKNKDEVSLTQSGIQKKPVDPNSLLEEIENNQSFYRQFPPNSEEIIIQKTKKKKLLRTR